MNSCSTVDSSLSKPTPVPVPRAGKECLKKPVPKPRRIVVNNGVIDDDLVGHRHDYDDVACSDSQGLSQLLKDEFKSASETVQEKGKAVLEGTRNVGARFERSMRSMIDRRRTTAATDDPEVPQPPEPRPCSLPSQDIFQSITFQSPLTGNGLPETPSQGSREDCSSPSAPPPVYPPPPLPDESVYDEIQSVVSSQSSGTHDPSYCSSISGSVGDSESYYEDISMVRGRSEESPSNATGVPVLRSDSWSFFDTAFKKPDEFPDPFLDGGSVAGNIYQDLPSTSASQAASCSGESTSLFGDSEKLHCGSGDTFEDDSFSNSPSSLSSMSVTNDLYNWATSALEPEVTPRARPEVSRAVPTPSVIFEFDPLCKQNAPSARVFKSHVEENKTCHNLPLSRVLSPYGKINKVVRSNSILEETDSDKEGPQGACPAIPPRSYNCPSPVPDLPVRARPPLQPQEPPRRDAAAPPATVPEPSVPRVERSLSEPQDQTRTTPEKARIARVTRWSSMKRAIKSVAEGSRLLAPRAPEDPAPRAVDRPPLSPHLGIHCGDLYKGGGDPLKRDLTKRYCVLAEKKISCYVDRSCVEAREVTSLESILSLQMMVDHKISVDGADVHCFKLTFSWKGRRSSYIFGWTGSQERKVWMQKILDNLTPVFPIRISCDFDRAGWCYMKEGISGTWTAGWILLTKRTLFYSLNEGSIQEIDLRKARCIELQDYASQGPRVSEPGPLVVLDLPGQSLYFQTDLQRETAVWRTTLKAASVDNGPNLAQQQLTRDDVPVLVEKCISFVYAHGSMSEGIYRRSGSNSNVERLLKQFRQDAWTVQLTRQEFTEYDVASVLKRFFRDLPEALLTTELHGELCEIAAGRCGSNRLTPYRKTLEKLPPVNFLTARKLLGHLFFIHEQHEKNLMPVDNLASIWGPTLLHTEGADSLTWSKVESSVVADLITFYPSLFDVDSEEVTRERRIQEALERLHAGNSNVCPNRPSGDLRVWVHIGTRDSKSTVNVTIGPLKLAEEVCRDLSDRMSLPAHELCLEEVVLGGALVRPLHHSERVLDAVLRWGYWDEGARKDNCLVLRRNTTLGEVAPLARPPLTHSAELRFADQKAKSFKTYLFEFSQAKLCYYKDKSGSVKLGEWKIEEIVWYLGHEPKRDPHMRWAITFVDKFNVKKRSKEFPFFGCTIAGSSKDELLKWMSAMLIGEYPQGILPSPTLLH